jgi:acylphosphatase
MTKRVHVYYSGRVQGVGFRFTAESIAGRLGVNGWVKNLGDSRVELLAEAEQDKIEDLLARLKSHFADYISDIDVQWEPAQGGYNDFRISF